MCLAWQSFSPIIQNYTSCEVKASYRAPVIPACSQSCIRFEEKIRSSEAMTSYTSVILDLDFVQNLLHSPKDEAERPFAASFVL